MPSQFFEWLQKKIRNEHDHDAKMTLKMFSRISQKMRQFSYSKKTPDEFYREMFENEKKRLREEEEKSFDDSIGKWFKT